MRSRSDAERVQTAFPKWSYQTSVGGNVLFLGDCGCERKMDRSMSAERHGAAAVLWFRVLNPTACKKWDAL